MYLYVFIILECWYSLYVTILIYWIYTRKNNIKVYNSKLLQCASKHMVEHHRQCQVMRTTTLLVFEVFGPKFTKQANETASYINLISVWKIRPKPCRSKISRVRNMQGFDLVQPLCWSRLRLCCFILICLWFVQVKPPACWKTSQDSHNEVEPFVLLLLG